MPCAACFQLNVHPGKNSFHFQHASFDCTYMFWRLLGIYEVFFLSSVEKFLNFLGGVRNQRPISWKRPNKQGEKFRLWSRQTDSFLCRQEKFSCIVWTPIWYVTLHFRDPRGAASLRYRNRVEITVRMCEQKHYPEWFLCWRKSYPVFCKNSLRQTARRKTKYPKNLESRPVIPDGWRHQACHAYRIFLPNPLCAFI